LGMGRGWVTKKGPKPKRTTLCQGSAFGKSAPRKKKGLVGGGKFERGGGLKTLQYLTPLEKREKGENLGRGLPVGKKGRIVSAKG